MLKYRKASFPKSVSTTFVAHCSIELVLDARDTQSSHATGIWDKLAVGLLWVITFRPLFYWQKNSIL